MALIKLTETRGSSSQWLPKFETLNSGAKLFCHTQKVLNLILEKTNVETVILLTISLMLIKWQSCHLKLHDGEAHGEDGGQWDPSCVD